MTREEFDSFLKPNYWHLLQKRVVEHEEALAKYRSGGVLESQAYAKEIGRKFAELKIEEGFLQKQIEDYDVQIRRERYSPITLPKIDKRRKSSDGSAELPSQTQLLPQAVESSPLIYAPPQ